jgi:hypothetical protein
MEYELHIAVPNHPVIRVVKAAIESLPQSTPPTIFGRLLNVTLLELLKLDSGEDVTVIFKGRQYKFIWLENDGTFELQRT